MGLAGFQLKSPKAVLQVSCLICMMWIFHFALLGELAGVIVTLVSLARCAGGAWFPKKYTDINNAICLVIALAIIIPAVSGFGDVFPIMAAISNSLSVYYRDHPLTFRLCNCVNQMSWLGFGVCISSLSLISASLLLLCSIVVSIFRYDLKGKRPMGLSSTTPSATI